MTSHDSSPFSRSGMDLRTARLILRPWTDGDLAAVRTGRRQPHWAADFPAEGDTVIAGHLTENPQQRHEFGQRQILERDSGLVVGSLGLFWPPADGALEIGYGIVASRRGRGYATEATRALVAFAFTAPGVRTVHATVERTNPASGRVLQKAGLTRCGGDATTTRYRATAPAPDTADGDAERHG